MIGIVEADADELACTCDAGTKPRIAGHGRQRRDIELREFVKLAGVERACGEIGNVAGNIADDAVGTEKTRLFLARFAITKKFHVLFP